MTKTWRMLLSGVVCLPSLLAQASFEIQPGQYLWHVWDTPVYRQAFPDWHRFAEDVAEINGLADADEAYRFLPAGYKLNLPPLPEESETSAAIDEKALREKIAKEEQEKLQQERAKMQSEKKDLEARINVLEKGDLWNWWMFAAVLLTLIGIWVLLEARNRLNRKNEEIESLKLDVAELRKDVVVLEGYLSKYLVPFTLPEDIGKTAGKNNVLYVLRAFESIDGDEAVWVKKKGVMIPIKRKNLKRYFDDAAQDFDNGDEDALRYFGVVRSHAKSKKPTAAPVPA